MKLQTVALAAATIVTFASSSHAAETPSNVDEAPTVAPSSQKTSRPRVGLFGAAGFPSPVSVGALVTIDQRFLFGVEYGFLPIAQIAGVDVTYRSWSADARWFPFRGGPFFVGVRAGRQHLAGSKTVTVSGWGSATGSTTADSWYVNPRLGLFRMWDSGFFVGADVGLKLPLGHSYAESVPYGQAMPEGVTAVRDTMSAKVIPTVTLAQLGFAF
ncbi:MAG: hypothetical protein HYV09_40100 [Deltaproteobacteria bacterium]|nr:hypothetical protein [Deltaproteobacteria bacterium]